MNIIKAQKNDFNEINSLIEGEFPYTKKRMNKISDRLNDGSTVFVAKEKNNFFGFIEFKFNGCDAKLLGLAVKKNFREKGVGKKLFDFFLGLCKKSKIEKVSLIVKKNNFQAKKLYKSRDFIKTGVLKKKIEDKTIESMELNLRPLKGIS